MTLPPFRVSIEQYLTLRRSLGFDLVKQDRILYDFARFIERTGYDGPITADLAMRWATSPGSRRPSNAARRLSILRGFARYRLAFDPATEIPAADLIPCRVQRRPPHIYSAAEIAALLRAASTLRPTDGLRPHCYVTLFALLASTGLRISEVCHLSCRDLDLRDGVLTIRAGKFRKSRLVPLHSSSLEPLRRFALRRDRSVPRSEFFFSTELAPHLTPTAVEMTFYKLRRRLGWSAAGSARWPRIHDLRHTFAVRRLLRWYEEGIDLDRKVAVLSTYLGHAKVTDTYWYLSAVPELMAITAQRFERCAHREQESVS